VVVGDNVLVRSVFDFSKVRSVFDFSKVLCSLETSETEYLVWRNLSAAELTAVT